MSHIILVRPPSSTKPGYINNHLPLGLLYLSESLIRENYKVDIIDAGISEIKECLDRKIENATLCIGISTMSGTQLCGALEIARYVRLNWPSLPIVWGGVHVTHLCEQSIANKFVDFVIWGEGETSFIELLREFQKDKNFHKVSGIGFKTPDGIIVTKNSGFTSLNRVFNLPYDMINMERYWRKLLIGGDREYYIWTSRGCPYSCHFCSNDSKAWSNRKVRYHTIEHIVNDISILHERYGADMINFGDENFLLKEERLISILKALEIRKIKIKFRFSARVDLLLKVKEDTWKYFIEKGLKCVGAGLESGSQRMLDYMNKGITLKMIYQLDETLTKHNLFKSYNFLVGLPGETIDDIKLTLKLFGDVVKTSLYCYYPVPPLYIFTPLPGTVMYENAKKYGFIPPDKLEDWINFEDEKVRNAEPGSVDKIRPWLIGELKDFTLAAIKVTENINNLMIGPGADIDIINQNLEKLNNLIKG